MKNRLILFWIILTSFAQGLQAQNIIGFSGIFTFDTKAPVVTLVAPNGGENLNANQPIQVSWTASDDQFGANPISVAISTSQSGSYQNLLQNTMNDGVHMVQPPLVSTQFAKMKVTAKDYYGNLGQDVSDNYFTLTSGLTNLNASFTASNQYPYLGEQVHFIDQSSGNPGVTSWEWNFGDGSPVFTTTNPSLKDPYHTYQKHGCYNVSLKVGNGTGTFDKEIKTGYIITTPVEKGIDLVIMETGQQNVVKSVRYNYQYKIKNPLTGNWIQLAGSKTFQVEPNGPKKEVHINQFENTSNFNTSTKKLISDFDNKLYLLNGNEECIGHIEFYYNHSLEKEYTRNLYIIFHNDNNVCVKNHFPYSQSTPGYDSRWTYYNYNEYPVSMLIPPKNEIISQYSKQPILFIHGWEGTYSYSKEPDATPQNNEVSYWSTTVKKLWDDPTFDAWQYYYPYNTDHKSISICLGRAIDSLRKMYSNTKKIGIVTHSMGSLPTMEWITSNPGDAKQKIKKVLFLGPPLHGSLGANIYYNLKDECNTNLSFIGKTLAAVLESFLKYDMEAPAVRDMKLASDIVWNINKRAWPDLNGEGGSNPLADDYFVIIGTTPKRYMSDGAIWPWSWENYPESVVFHSAEKHHDGIVSISSASLLDHNIGFATIHGNHNDCVHAQSKNPGDQNIGNPDLIPDIVKNYFSNDYTQFISNLSSTQSNSFSAISAIVGEDKKVIKPYVAGPDSKNLITLENLNSNTQSTTNENDVDYQYGTINVEFPHSTGNSRYVACYKPSANTIRLYPTSLSYPFCIVPYGWEKIGIFHKNLSNEYMDRYFFMGLGYDFGLVWIPNSSALKLPVGEKNIVVYKNYLQAENFPTLKFDFRYCETQQLSFIIPQKSTDMITNNETDNKIKNVLTIAQLNPDSAKASIYIDNQTDNATFLLTCVEATDNNVPVILKMKMPDGVIIDSSYSYGTFSQDTISGLCKMEISNPQPGKWYVWAESGQSGADTLQSSAMAYLKSDIYAYLINDTATTFVGNNYRIVAGLELDTLNLSDSLVVRATIIKPNGDTLIYDLSSSKTSVDTAYSFSQYFLADTTGYYSIKINMDGVYDGYRFERVLFQEIEATDTTVRLLLPDVVLTQNNESKSIDLRDHAFNYNCHFDSLQFSTSVLSSDLDESSFSYFINDTTWTAYFNTSLTDTGTVVFKFTMLMPGNKSVSDTCRVSVAMPELIISEPSTNIVTVSADSILVASCKVKNLGNTYANSFELKYFLSEDTGLDSSDLCIGKRSITYLEKDSVANCLDTLVIPALTDGGNWRLLFIADADNDVRELNDSTNNLAHVQITVRRLSVLTGKLNLEGLFNPETFALNQAQDITGPKYPGNVADHITVSLASPVSPFSIVKTFPDVELSTSAYFSVTLPDNLSGSYYLIIKHRNSIETWSSEPISINAYNVFYNFTDMAEKAYGNNLKSFESTHLIYTGDPSQDGIIDGTDMNVIGNMNDIFAIGYIDEDINGDGIIDGTDMNITGNNNDQFIVIQTP